MKNFIYITLLVLLNNSSISHANGFVDKNTDRTLFSPNKGQLRFADGKIASEILYSTFSNGLKVFVRSNGLSYQFIERKSITENNRVKNNDSGISSFRIDMTLVDANPNPIIEEGDKTDYHENFYGKHFPDGI
ncbi:MAG: hypothetical protein ACK5C5_01930, partial [Bacteroidota bacterium]